jgi:DNA-binding transcriptional ArsR family regulator
VPPFFLEGPDRVRREQWHLTQSYAKLKVYMHARISMPQQLANFKSEFFKALAHPIRIRILDSLRDGEKGVNELSEILKIEPANVSQQLAILRMRNIVIGRKVGSNVYYSVSDPTLFRLLDVARDIFNNHLVGVRDMLQQMDEAS